MSLYTCIDLIDDQLNKLRLGRPSILQSAVHFISSSAEKEHHQSVLKDQSFLTDLKNRFIQRIKEDDYKDLLGDSELLEQYLKKEKQSLSRDCISYIINDLTKIDSKINPIQKEVSKEKQSPTHTNQLHNAINSKLTDYKKFQSPEYRIAEIKQGQLYKLGLSPGECLGFTYSMAHPKLSPYQNPGMKIDLTQQVHNYQKFQNNRSKDQGTIKRTRLTREHFNPNKEKQAKDILEYAEQHQGKELLLVRRGSVGAHACYLNIQDNGFIRYMDPNHGAYLFKNKQDFIDFYVVAAKKEKKSGVDFRFYTLSELKYDEHNVLEESNTRRGILRTILTGAKYNDNRLFSNAITSGVSIALGGGIGAGIGALIGSIVPGIGTVVGATIGAVVGGFLGNRLDFLAHNQGHLGLLAVPHLIQDIWQDLKEYTLDAIFPSPKKMDKPEDLTTPAPSQSSTASILSRIQASPPSASSMDEKQVKPIIDIEKNDKSQRDLSKVAPPQMEHVQAIAPDPESKSMTEHDRSTRHQP